jgi:hypothetical protein
LIIWAPAQRGTAGRWAKLTRTLEEFVIYFPASCKLWK